MKSFEWAGGNLDAGPLAAYTFAVSATIGHRYMTYTFVRLREPGRVLTVVRIDAPATLEGTEVVIREPVDPAGCFVSTAVPTMRAPREIRPPRLFDTLPLTDISYLDLIRSLSPSLFPPPTTTPVDDPARGVRGTEVSYRAEGIGITELYDGRSTTPVSRTVSRDGRFERSWHVTEPGSPEEHGIPAVITVSRVNVPGPTVFRRVTPVTPIEHGSPPTTAAGLLASAAAHLGPC